MSQGERTEPSLAELRERLHELLKLPDEELFSKSGVGTLSEKRLHAALKLLIQPDRSLHEAAIGRFTADILENGTVTEIQTRSLDRLREKLGCYLAEGYSVNVVEPVAHKKWIVWVDPETKEALPERRSPKTGSYYDALWELYKIKDYLGSPGLRLTLLLMDVRDIRRLDGFGKSRKRRSNREERVPVELAGMISLSSPEDYRAMLLPEGLIMPFSAADLAQAARIPSRSAYTAINILLSLGMAAPAGKMGRRRVYKITEQGELT